MTRLSRERRRDERWHRGSARPRLTWRGLAVSIAVAAAFLAFATYISFVAPVHVLLLERERARSVRADATRQLWLFIPLRARTLSDVESVSTRTPHQPGSLEPGRSDGSGGSEVRPEAEEVIVLSGESGSLEISTSPRDVYDIERRINQFLSGSDKRLRVWLVSNWKVAVIVETMIMVPALLILLAVAWDIGNLGRRLVLTRLNPPQNR